MLALVPLLLLVQSHAVDPLSQRMVIFCKGKAACVEKQKQGVRTFLDILTRQRPAQPVVQKCLAKSSKNKVTDWARAERCLGDATRRGRKR